MNRNEALERALEFKEISEKCDEVSFIDRDTEFFEYVIKELTAQEVPVQEQSKFISKCPICSYQNELITSKCVNPSFCMNCGGKTTYQNIPLL